MKMIRTQRGFSLMEVLIGVFLSTVLMSGIIQLMGGSVSAYRLQLNQSQVEESFRYARDVLNTARQALCRSHGKTRPELKP